MTARPARTAPPPLRLVAPPVLPPDAPPPGDASGSAAPDPAAIDARLESFHLWVDDPPAPWASPGAALVGLCAAVAVGAALATFAPIWWP